MGIKEMCEESYDNAKEHGFWEDVNHIEKNITDPEFKKEMINNAIATRLHLVTCEVAEATEALRQNDMKHFREEIADCFIRLGNICKGLDIDIEIDISEKMAINITRPYKHNKEF